MRSIFLLLEIVSFHVNVNLAKVIFISIDGFRWDYLQKHSAHMPVMSKLLKESTFIQNGMTNVFPTETFPNHWSMVTGLWPENHGIIANNFYDRTLADNFTMLELDAAFWKGSEMGERGNNTETEGIPIWVRAEQNNITTVVVHYPGLGVNGFNATYSYPENNIYFTPYYSLHYIFNLTFAALYNETNPAELAIVYLGEPDETGHMFGPNDDLVVQRLIQFDYALQFILDQLHPTDNLILTSDHGMTSVNNTFNMEHVNKEFTDDLVLKMLRNGPSLFLYAHPGKARQLEQKAKLFALQHRGIEFYTKKTVPKRWHIGNSERFPDVMLMLPYNWAWQQSQWLEGQSLKGLHGWDNNIADMHPIFVGYGDNFKKNYIHNKILYSIDMYPLISHLIGIPILNNTNGKLHRVLPLLVDSNLSFVWKFVKQHPIYTYLIGGFLLGLLLLFCCYALLRFVRFMRKRRRDKSIYKGGYFLGDMDSPSDDMDYDDATNGNELSLGSGRKFKLNGKNFPGAPTGRRA